MGTVVAQPAAPREDCAVSDHDLVAAVRMGQERAFELLYERYHRRIAAYVYGMVNDYGRAEDITQEVFISALRRMRDTERPIALKPWLYEIAKNACIDQFRRSRRSEEISFDAEATSGVLDDARLASIGAGPDAAVDAKQQLRHLCGAFGGLSDSHHQILVMRELEGLSYREIGDRMGLSRGSVESTLFRARRRLSEEYEELVSGERCVRVRSIILATSAGVTGARDERRLLRHVAHCQPCRREARLAGVEIGSPSSHPVRDALVTKVAAFLPFPALLQGRRTGSGAATAAPGLAAQVTGPLTTMAEPLAGWTKAVAVAVAVVLAGTGSGVMSPSQSERPRDELHPAPAAAQPQAFKRSGQPAATPKVAPDDRRPLERRTAVRDQLDDAPRAGDETPPAVPVVALPVEPAPLPADAPLTALQADRPEADDPVAGELAHAENLLDQTGTASATTLDASVAGAAAALRGD